MQEYPAHRKTPRLVHLISVFGVLVIGVLLLTSVTTTKRLVVLVAVPALLAAYWRFRSRPGVVACYFGMALSVVAWILLCENIVLVDRFLGTRVSTRLRLNPRLTSYVLSSLPTEDRRELKPCCNDPLMWHYRPGSRHRAVFDCPTCTPPQEVTVDQTGYLNQAACPPQCYPQIDLFVAGDSVLQGAGVPSVVEKLRRLIPLRLWNLSIQAYGPRQKIDALLTWAVPHTPRWLVVEFYAGNDLAEAIRDDVCQRGGDYRCRYNGPAVERRLAQDPGYANMFDVRTDRWARFADYTTENLTLATTRFVLDALRHPGNALANAGQVSPGLPARNGRIPPAIGQITVAPWLALGGAAPATVRKGHWPAYVSAGLAVTQREYERLATALAQQATPPAVILLYNPAPYEIYRLGGMEVDARAEQIYPVQREALGVFAHEHGWQFLDLTEPLRRVVRRRDAWLNIWLYGEFDQSHWSPEGTAVVAEVLATELSAILRSN